MHCRLIELCCVRQRSRLDTVPVANSLYMHLSAPHTGHVTHLVKNKISIFLEAIDGILLASHIVLY